MKKQKVSVVQGMLRVEYPTIGKVFTAKLSAYPDGIRVAAMEHGFKQKFGDAASGGTPAEKLEEVQAIHASLMQGNWERTSTPDMTGIILEAVHRLKKEPMAKLEKVAEKYPEKVKEWGANLKVKAEIAQIRAEKAAKAAESQDEEEIDIEV